MATFQVSAFSGVRGFRADRCGLIHTDLTALRNGDWGYTLTLQEAIEMTEMNRAAIARAQKQQNE
jgi:hypothetical protein